MRELVEDIVNVFRAQEESQSSKERSPLVLLMAERRLSGGTTTDSSKNSCDEVDHLRISFRLGESASPDHYHTCDIEIE